MLNADRRRRNQRVEDGAIEWPGDAVVIADGPDPAVRAGQGVSQRLRQPYRVAHLRRTHSQ